MIYLVNIMGFFQWKYLIVLLAGIFFGFVFMMLIYLYSVILSLRKKSKHQDDLNKIEELEIELLIKDAQKQYKNKKLRKELGVFGHFKNVVVDLASDIAKKYYPKSSYPLLEISVEESLQLTNYISERINEFLSAKILAPLKRRTLAQIKSIWDVKGMVEKTAVVKAAKKVNAGRIGKTVMGIINILNPAYWIKRIFTDRLNDIIIIRICFASISVVGQETYKIYSKSVFEKENAGAIDVDDLYETIFQG